MCITNRSVVIIHYDTNEGYKYQVLRLILTFCGINSVLGENIILCVNEL